MPIINRIGDFQSEMTAWRRDFHANPELAFEEVRTSGIVAEKLQSWGIEIHRGMGRTGVVGVLRGGSGGNRAIGLRADMDALPMQEENDFGHRSMVDGKMHACGHDGHTTMLLGAAKYLSETKNFDGTVYFIFQPAEEGKGGGMEMIKDGLFEQFQMDRVYGMHNWPELPAGSFGVFPGPIMAGSDEFKITIEGRGGHGAMPHHTIDPVIVASQIVMAFQSIVARNVEAMEQAVLSVTQIHSGSAFNVIPREAWLSGTVRTFKPEIQDMVEANMARIVENTAKAFGAEATMYYRRGYPSTVNAEEPTTMAERVAAAVVGAGNVHTNMEPCMGAEDFSYMLHEKPGCYVWVGQAGGPSGCMVHNPKYDFNDEILSVGASYWAQLVEAEMPRVA